MRRILFAIMANILVFIYVTEANAAQTLVRSIYTENGYQSGSYSSTPKRVYTEAGWVSSFQDDGFANYPNEIYLPNEHSPANYRIHTNYTKNTDACASCHATHTAVGGSLLQWYTNYETCMACHDGTVATTYNVVLGRLPDGQVAAGGAFGTGQEKYSSYHNITGGAVIGSAPGNNLSVGQNNQKLLGCESCHSPHGLGGNARLLNPDPNGVQSKQAENFIEYQLTEIYDEKYSEIYVTYVAYPKNIDGSANSSTDPYYMLNSYPYRVKLTINGQVYRQQGDVYKIDNHEGYSKVQINKIYNIDINTITADFIPSIRIRMNISNYLGNGGKEDIRYRDGTVKFCSACHDYYKDEQTVSMAAYRHPVDKKIYESSVAEAIYTESPIWISQLQYKFETDFSMTCLTCHVAHGTSNEYWQDSIGYSSDQSKEQAGSSALKRAPNSDLCELCHNKESLSEGYHANTQQPHNEQPYATNDAIFTQPLGIANYQGSNRTSCYSNSTSFACHGTIIDTWKTTSHSKSVQDVSAIDASALNTFFAETGLNSDQVVYVLGNEQVQRYVYNAGGILAVTKNQFIISNQSWEEKPPVEDFIKKCAGCHVTGLNITNSSWKDNGVVCEACHGAAANHYKVPSSRNITNPRYLSNKDQTDICAQCHTLGQNSNMMYFDYPYPIGYMPYAEGLTDSVWRAAYALSNFFTAYTYQDASVKGNFYDQVNINSNTYDSAFAAQEFNDFIQSKHYQSGALSCITCHSSHQHNNSGEMLKLSLEQTCGNCHGTSFNLEAIMPKRLILTNNPLNNLRVHTFANQHSTSATLSGSSKQIH